MAYALEDEFGDIIGKARRGQNLSPSEIATAAGITEAELARMEQYTLKPTETQVHRLAEVLNLDGTKLLDIATEQWEPEPPQQVSESPLEVITISAPVGGWPVNAYILICQATNDAAIVDTAAHPDLILEQLDAPQCESDSDPANTRPQRPHRWITEDPNRYRMRDLHPYERTETAERNQIT